MIAPAEGTAVAESDGYSPRAAKVLENAEKEAVRFHADAIGTEHILIAMIKETDCVASRLLTTLSVNMQKVFVDTLIAMGEDANLYREEFQNGRPGKKKNNEGTPTLDQYSRDLTQLATEGALDPVVGREEEIQRVIQILSRRTKNNPCLIGEPGVGKTGAANPSCRTMLNLSNWLCLIYFVQLRIAKVKPSRKVPLISTW